MVNGICNLGARLACVLRMTTIRMTRLANVGNDIAIDTAGVNYLNLADKIQ